jgi:hypothetical protein
MTVSGRVVDRDGRGMAGRELFLFYALDGQFHPEIALKIRSEKDGSFSFDRVEAAKFILVVESRNGKVFFPGTREAMKAKVIEVDEGKPVSDLTITLP